MQTDVDSMTKIKRLLGILNKLELMGRKRTAYLRYELYATGTGKFISALDRIEVI